MTITLSYRRSRGSSSLNNIHNPYVICQTPIEPTYLPWRLVTLQ